MNTNVLLFRNIQPTIQELIHIVEKHLLGGIITQRQMKEVAIEELNKGKIHKFPKVPKMDMLFNLNSFNLNSHKPIKYGLREMLKM